jgi:large subunit ribosomal protein L32e
MTEEYNKNTVAELKVLLKEQGLPVSGNKKDLIARLEKAVGDVSDDADIAEADLAAEEEVVEQSQEDEESEDDFEDYDDEDWDEEESELHVARQKPVLDDELRAALALRAAQKAKTPKFRRTEWYRYFRLARSGWRKPKGMDNKQRRNYRYRSSLVRVGHGKVATARGLHPSGFAEVMVQNVADLNQIDAEKQAARVGATVGGRKREMIHERADELGIRILNRRRSR